jgi:hypothetical protein
LSAVLKIEEQVGDLDRPFGFDIWIADTIDRVLAEIAIIPSSETLPEIPQAPDMSFDKQAVDRVPHLRHHRAVAALRHASAALETTDSRHVALLDLIEQYISYSGRFSSEFSLDPPRK